MRGEKLSALAVGLENVGSPPRARGKAQMQINVAVMIGITPACAGKSMRPTDLLRAM